MLAVETKTDRGVVYELWRAGGRPRPESDPRAGSADRGDDDGVGVFACLPWVCPLAPMSSDACSGVFSSAGSVGEHRSEHDVGESSLERPEGFAAVDAGFGSTSQGRDRVGE